MNHRPARLLLAGVCLAMGLGGASQAKENRPNIPETQMPAHCKAEAATAFRVQIADILTLPVERSNGQYFVYGQSPAQGQNALFFVCGYNRHTEFAGVKMTSDKRGQTETPAPSVQGERISRDDMPRYCAGMASEKFGMKPRYFDTAEAVRESDETFTVKGTYEAASGDTKHFICKFDSKRRFTSVYPTKR